MPAGRLLIGPLLRRVVGTRATVWVETSAPAVVAVRAAGGASGTAPTFSAYDHHYALVVVEGLAPDSAASYEVLIDDEMAWRAAGYRRDGGNRHASSHAQNTVADSEPAESG
jgi:hypothetical protein